MGEETHEMDTRIALLVAQMERVVRSIDEVVAELRATNSQVAAQGVEFRLSQQRIEAMAKELYNASGASRVQVLELQVRGLWACVSLLLLSIAGKYLPMVWGAFAGS